MVNPYNSVPWQVAFWRTYGFSESEALGRVRIKPPLYGATWK